MDHIRTSTKMNVRHCTLCQGETEYYCHSCQKDLCQHCKATHVIDLNTKDHDVTLYREKFNYLLKRDTCVLHSNRIYNKYCESCEIPVCNSCTEHISQGKPLLASGSIHHKLLEIRTVYQTKRQQHKEMIHNVRSEILYNSRVLLKELKSDVNTDVETCHREISRGQPELIKRGQVLKHLMDRVLLDEIKKQKAKYKAWWLKQKKRMAQYITWIQIYEHRYEQLAYRPVKFLRFIKKARLPQIQDTPQHCRLSLTQEINMEDLIELLSELQITEGGKRKLQAGNELLLTLLPSPVLQKSTTVKGVYNCYHISCVTPDRVWVSDDNNNLILTDTTTGDKLHSVRDSLRSPFGIHTVNSECELIYKDKDYNINKLSSDLKTTTRFIKKPEDPWRPQCVYCSPSSGDLLVGMYRRDTETWTYTGEVRRYNNTGELTQTIPHNNTHQELYGCPDYITENNNGDIVVSDWDRAAVVVTDREGRHRFSYRGPPSGSGLNPLGICTDALSHILVCDGNTHTVQMINKDGDFLSYLLTTESPGIHHDRPRSLSYDVNTHTLYVGSRNNNTVSVYRHINRHLTITDNVEVCDDVSVRGSPPSRRIPGYSQESSTGDNVISHDKPNIPVTSGAGFPADPDYLFAQLNLPPDLANVLQSFQQGGTLPPNLDQGSAQNILASMMGTIGDPNTGDAFYQSKQSPELFQSMQNPGVMRPMHPPGPGMRIMGPPPGGILGAAPLGFPMMGPGGMQRFPGGPGGDKWGENMICGPPMRGRGRARIPMRGCGPRGPPPGVPSGPPMGPPMRGGRGVRIRQVMGPMHLPEPGMRMMGPPPGGILGAAPPGFPMMGPGGMQRFPGGPGGDKWGENMIGGPPMRGRGRARIPMRGCGPRGPPPGVPGGPPMGPPMRGGRGVRIRQVTGDRAVCRHFAAGGCRRGNTCSFLHPGVNGLPV